MKTSELRQKSQVELQKILIESREKLRQLRFTSAVEKVRNVREVRKVRKDVARILTLLKQKNSV